MLTKTYSKGLLLWIDDSLNRNNSPNDPWREIFGDHSDRVYRLLDLSLDIAGSYKEAVDKIDGFNSYQSAGMFAYCVVDLRIPSDIGMIPELINGVDVAKKIRDNEIHFSFLSSNTRGASLLDEEQLSTLPYYVKIPGNIWKFPERLVLSVLSEFRRSITWVNLEDIISLLPPNSQLAKNFRLNENTFKFFPFFGPFHEYVLRCEYRDSYELHHPVAIRSAKKHCDEFIQQAILILLYQSMIDSKGNVELVYGHAHKREDMDEINNSSNITNPAYWALIRVSPNYTSVNELRSLVESSHMRSGKTIFILPNDESADEYIQLLRTLRVKVIEELPQIQYRDLLQREELIRQSCNLTFQQWFHDIGKEINNESPILLDKGSLLYPELFINPIYWTTLLETEDVPELLSDPFEIVNELNTVLNNIRPDSYQEIRNALECGQPIKYTSLLKVGHKTLLKSDLLENRKVWIERSLDNWLKKSWHTPYGITNPINENLPMENNEVLHGWQDSCYEILDGLLNDYSSYIHEVRGKKVKDFQRVGEFVKILGGKEFITDDVSYVNWDQLEYMRWPHRKYPIPSSVMRRLRQAGRYLWIQPEGLDLSLTLPVGRQRYRNLNNIIEHYWSVLKWLDEISDQLPRGWQKSISYLTQLITNHKIAEAWQSDRASIWNALLGLLRNGSPVMYLANKYLHVQPIEDENGRLINLNLAKITHYGQIMKPLRYSRKKRINEYLLPSFDDSLIKSDLERLSYIKSYLTSLKNLLGSKSNKAISEIETSIFQLMEEVSNTLLTNEENAPINNLYSNVSEAITSFYGNNQLNITEGGDLWFHKDLLDSDLITRGDLPSLFGTKADYLWKLFDIIVLLENITHRYRYYDGYHFLACLNDLRIQDKDSDPIVPLSIIELVMELYVASIQGLIAQLAFLVEISGEKTLAENIKPPFVNVVPENSFEPPSLDELNKFMKIKKGRNYWAVYTLGIPGARNVNRLSYHDWDQVKNL